MFWVWQVVLWIASVVTSYALQPRQKGQDARPGSVSDFDLPTTEEGTILPVLRGTGLLRGSIMTSFGEYQTIAIKDHDQVLGYHYGFGARFAFCHGPLDEVRELRFDDKPVGPEVAYIPPGKMIRVEAGSGPVDIALPSGHYRNLAWLAAAVTSHLRAWVPDFGALVYGAEFPALSVMLGEPHIEALQFSVTIDGTQHWLSAEIVRGAYRTEHDLAAALTQGMAAGLRAGGGPWGLRGLIAVWTYDAGPGTYRLTLSADASVSEFLINPTSPVLPYLGIEHSGASVFPTTIFPATHQAEHPTAANRYFFDLAPGVTVHWPESNCHDLFGMLADAPDFVAPQVCDLARIFTKDFATFLPQGWGTVVNVQAPNLYGGTDGGGAGGVVGWLNIYHGTQNQGAWSYLNGLNAAYPGIAHVICWMLWGTQTVVRALAMVARSTPNPLELSAGHERIGDDYNPGSLLWEICTDVIWGAAITPELLDRAAFVALAEQCHAEGLGVTMVFDSASTGTDLCEEVCRHINAMPYIDPLTGLFSFRLVRADYELASLPEINETQLRNVRFSRPSWGKTSNTVRVRFIDRALGFIDGVRTVTNDAALAAQDGRIAAVDLDFRGFSHPAAALRAAWRELAPVSYPFAVLEADCDRSVWRQHPSSVFLFTSERLGIFQMPMRMASLNGGTLEDGSISFQAAEDVFGLDVTGYGEPPDPIAQPDLGTGAIMAWTDYRSAVEIYCQRFGRDGVAQFAANGMRVNGGTTYAEALGLEGGDLIVTYDHGDEVRAARLDVHGYVIWDVLVGAAALVAFESSLVADGDGGVIVLFHSHPVDDSSGLYAQRVDGQGNVRWLEPLEIRHFATGTGEVTGSHGVVSDGTGGMLVFWGETVSDRTHIRGQRVDHYGLARWSAGGIVVSPVTSAADEILSGVCPGSGGGAFVAWKRDPTDASDPTAVIVRVLANGTVSPEGPRTLSEAGQYVTGLRCASDRVGGAYLAWDYDLDGGTAYGAAVQRINYAQDLQWLMPLALASSADTPEVRGAIADGSGGILIAYVAWPVDIGIVHLAKISAAGELLFDVAATDSTADQSAPVLCTDGSGGALVAWLEGESPTRDLYAQRVSGSGELLWGDGGVVLCDATGDQNEVRIFPQTGAA